MMNALYASAVDRIRDEMAATKDEAIQAVGEMMTEQLRAQPQISELVQKKDKTLSGAYKAISDYASKHRTGNHAVVPPAKAMELIAAYYGFTPTDGKPSAPNQETQATAEEAARPSGALKNPQAGAPLPYAGAPSPATVAVEGEGLPPVKAARLAPIDDELDLDKLLEG